MSPTNHGHFWKLALLTAFISFGAFAQHNQTLPVGKQAEQRRSAPPDQVGCDRGQLTSYTGIVSDYHRAASSLTISVSTDWGTEESLAIQRDDGEFTLYFLLFNGPFSEEDWHLIESEPGKLLPAVRVTAWVCLDGVTPPLIDWQPGYSKPGRGQVQP